MEPRPQRSVKGAAIAAAFESKVRESRRVEPMNGRPEILAVVNVRTNALLTRQPDHVRDKAMRLSRTMDDRARQSHSDCAQAAIRQGRSCLL
jgi:hypothetical protein